MDMKRFSIRFSLKIFFIAFPCFLLASSSWAQPEGFSQSENEQFLIPDQMTPLGEKESLTPEQKTASEEEEFL